MAMSYLGRAPLDMGDVDDESTQSEDESEPQDEDRNLRVLQAILSLVDTAAPLAASLGEDHEGIQDHSTGWDAMSFERAHRLSPKAPASPDLSEFPSSNTAEYHSALAHNLPTSLLRRLNSQQIDSEWDVTPVAEALYRLVAYHALLSDTEDTYWDPLKFSPVMPTLTLHKRAYNLGYLTRHRMYGPFIPLVPSSGDDDSDPEDPSQFKADWAQLAAAALLMRMILGTQDWITDYRLGADALRPGAWLPHTGSPAALGNGGMKEECDWAGVGGMWRYVLRLL